jgi:hypothetical protein
VSCGTSRCHMAWVLLSAGRPFTEARDYNLPGSFVRASIALAAASRYDVQT